MGIRKGSLAAALLALTGAGFAVPSVQAHAATTPGALPSTAASCLSSVAISQSGFSCPGVVTSGHPALRPSASIPDLASALTGAGAQANGAPATWELTQRTEPIRRYSPAMVYDAAHADIVLFGGSICQGGSCFEVDDTWTWDGSRWTQRHPATSPPARILAGMAYDPSTADAVLFGGATCTVSACTAMNDTWIWDGSDWKQENPPTSPPARYSAAMSFDGHDVVMFGGCIASCPEVGAGDPAFGAMGSDTWTWDGATWTPQTTLTSPSPRGGAAFAYDAALKEAVLFSGAAPQSNNEVNPPVPDDDDTWAWNGNAWSQLAPLSSPPGRQGAGIAYDDSRSEIVLFGGYDDGNFEFVDSFRQDTWVFDGTTWTPQTSADQPWRTESPGLAYDPNLGASVLVGGFSFTAIGSSGAGVLTDEKYTWTLDASGWTELQTTWPDEREGATMAYDPATSTVIMTGGLCLDILNTCPDTWSWDGGGWTELHPATPAPNTFLGAFAYDTVSRRLLLSLGGATWAWDGSDWMQLHPADSPPASAWTVMAPDAHGELILFRTCESDTWAWNGDDWAHVTTATSPPPRSRTTVAYDAQSRQLVLFGGTTCSLSQYLSDTWVWDGSSWVQEQPASSPTARGFHAMGYDPGTGDLLVFGGVTEDQTTGVLSNANDTWQWNGSDWEQLSPATSPGALLWASMAEFPPGGTLMLTAGNQDNSRPVSDTWVWSAAPAGSVPDAPIAWLLLPAGTVAFAAARRAGRRGREPRKAPV
jgi:hypothetical protein